MEKKGTSLFTAELQHMCAASHTYPHAEVIKHEFRHMYFTNTCDIHWQRREIRSQWKTRTDKPTLYNNVAASLCNSQPPRILYMSKNYNRVQIWNVGYYLSLSHVYNPAIVSCNLHLHAVNSSTITEPPVNWCESKL